MSFRGIRHHEPGKMYFNHCYPEGDRIGVQNLFLPIWIPVNRR